MKELRHFVTLLRAKETGGQSFPRKGRVPTRCATANEADSRALPCCGLKFDNTYKGFTFGTGIADLYAGIELHGERRSFYAVPSDVLPGQRCAQVGRLLGSDAGGDCICWVGSLGNEIELDAP